MPLGFKAPSSLGELSSCGKSFVAGEPSALRRCCRAAFSMNGELTDPNRTIFNNTYMMNLLSGSSGFDSHRKYV